MYTVDVGRESGWRVLVAVAPAPLLVLLDATVVDLALPTIRTALTLSTTSAAWILNGYTICFSGVLLGGGKLADRLGARRVLAAGLVVFTTASLGCALARSAVALITARCAQGVGAGLVYPSALAVLLATYRTPTWRHRALAFWSALGGVGATVGVVAGGLLVEEVGWRAVFWINLPIGLAALVAAGICVPKSRGQLSGTGWRTAIGWSALAAAAVLATLSVRAGAAEFQLVLAGVLAVPAVLALVVIRLRYGPSSYSGTVRHGVCGQALLGATQTATMYAISFHVQTVLHRDPLVAALAFLPMGLNAVCAGLAAGRIANRTGVRKLWAAAAGLAALALLLMAALSPLHRLALVVAPSLLVGAALPLMSFCGTSTASTNAGPDVAGDVSGRVAFGFQTGAALGVAAAAIALHDGLTTSYLVIAIAPASIAALAIRNA